MSGLPHNIKFYKLWHTVCASWIKNTQSLLSMSRDAASGKNAHTDPIALQENLLTVICVQGVLGSLNLDSNVAF